MQNLNKFLFSFAQEENVFYTIIFYLDQYQDTNYKPPPSFLLTKDSHCFVFQQLIAFATFLFQVELQQSH